MALVRFGEDHHVHFDSKAFLSSYYKAEGGNVETYYEFTLGSYHEFWSKMTKKDLRVLVFGGGPVVYDLISAACYSDEIIFAEYTAKNRQEVEKWLQNSADSHDWTPFFQFVVKNLEGKKNDEVAIRESELRKKISHVLPCDIGWEDPVKWPSNLSAQTAMFDVVTTSLCLEVCVTSSEGYRHAIAKLKRFLKPGGYIVLYGVLEETFYMVGQEKFHCFPLSKQLIEETLASEGFQILDEVKIFPLTAENTEPFCDAKGNFFVSAVLH